MNAIMAGLQASIKRRRRPGMATNRSISGGAASIFRPRRWIGPAESLKDTIARVLPYWESRIAPELKAGKRIIISAHGNSLRALVKHLSGISDEEIPSLEIPTGQPMVYELDGALKATDRYYLSER